ncbi:MAG TPA: SAF domain-containing protein [Actinomycetales bacterium]|nr:SAF domain-containing protein [Actinomycetales bacterium]
MTSDVRTSRTPAAPVAPRLRPPSWRDPRLVVGVLVVLLGVVLGSLVVSAADDTVPVYAAARTLTPGDAVDADAVRVVDVRLAAADRYLSAAQPLPDGLVALRSVGEGELLARSGLGDASVLEVKPVGIGVDGVLPAGLDKGSRVDVWVSLPDPERAGAFTEPERLVEAAEVSEVSESGGALGSGGTSTVQVLMEDEPLRGTLAALANGAEVALVLVPGAGSSP